MPETTLAVIESNQPWGEANKLRGIAYHDHALAFAGAFEVGKTLTPDAFDEWAHQRGYMPQRPETMDKRSDSWLAHLQRRHELRYRINQAATHPRMTDSGAKSFIIVALRRGPNPKDQLWEVRSPEAAIAQHEAARRIESLITTKRRQLAYLMQSADWAQLPPAERIVAEELHSDITYYEQRVVLESKQLEDKFGRLRLKLKRAVAAGELKPINGGVRALTESDHLDSTESAQ